MGIAALLTAVTLSVTPASFVASRQQADGGFAEAGSRSTPGLTAWAMLGLRAAGRSTGKANDYLVANERDLQSATDIELAVIAEAATGGPISETLYARFAALGRPDGRFGPAINSTAWGILAYAQVGRPFKLRVSYLLRHQHRSGGWGWIAGAAPDSNDTAAVVQALRTQGVRGRPIARGLAFLRRLHGSYSVSHVVSQCQRLVQMADKLVPIPRDQHLRVFATFRQISSDNRLSGCQVLEEF